MDFFCIILIMEIVAIIGINRYCDSETKRKTFAVIGGTMAVVILGVSVLWAMAGQQPDFSLFPFLLLAIANAGMAGCTHRRPSRHA